ncbi:carbohydrate ABC transporter permease [Isoptericola sp. BMS4]|uniref:carbohydrate ABC transporter permease n=1 Tax=Isoptericola sp. BMS4 TaxID=2527875 RepID=UPI00141F6917|nr:carbohydrate ABC transporter permease [Isoptericola sp. BMS4]
MTALTSTRGSSTIRRAPRPRVIVSHVALIAGALLMAYPVLWMLSSSLKPEAEIFNNLSLVPSEVTLDNYTEGWTGLGMPFGVFLWNSLVVCVVSVVANCASCLVTAYAFARMELPLRWLWFPLMLMTIMLPLHVTILPQYIVFNQLGWVGTFLPLIVPKLLAVDAFFVYLMVQFMRSLPRELDDAASIDGCGPFRTFSRIIVPLMVPALVTTAIFTFLWTWSDFFSQLLYLGSNQGLFTVPVALASFIDATTSSSWGQLLSMSVVSLIPVVAFFAVFQRWILDGVSTTGIK